MIFLRFRIIIATSLLLIPYFGETQIDSHLELTLRKVGHHLLLNSGDDTSRVLPIEKVEDRFLISFQNEFSIVPIEMAKVIQPIIQNGKIASEYRIEVETCDSNLVVYGYEISVDDTSNVIACSRRLQPKDCYKIYFTILAEFYDKEITEPTIKNADTVKNRNPVLVLSIVLFLIGLCVISYWRITKSKNHADIILLGKYQFNQRKMELILRSNVIELTSKESDLLLLLYRSANETIERKVLLSKVWGDEGDYVGRTLDVFISKLRKKLVGDQSVKIVNVRGVGYKMILDY